MHSLKTLEIKDEAVKITWCACAVCSAVGPRFMTLIRNHEYTVELDTHCCGLKSGDSSIRMEDALIARDPSPIDRHTR
jgi:hypothetical protein